MYVCPCDVYIGCESDVNCCVVCFGLVVNIGIDVSAWLDCVFFNLFIFFRYGLVNGKVFSCVCLC